jgi:uncharacterized protein with NRDE domain
MCVSAVAIGASPHWPVLLAGNRDEALARPTAALHAWSTPNGVSVRGGRDELDGGGWLLVSADGKAAALVTNVRDAQLKRGEFSRGQLTVAWVEAVASGQVQPFLDRLKSPQFAQSHGGYNLICGLPQQGIWWHHNNREGAGLRQVTAGVHGVSNASLNTPWPKTRKLQNSALQALEHKDFDALSQTLWTTLSDSRPAAPPECPGTGVGLQAERALSSVYIHWPERAYGTRSSHILALDAQGHWHMVERCYDTALEGHLAQRHSHQSLSW